MNIQRKHQVSLAAAYSRLVAFPAALVIAGIFAILGTAASYATSDQMQASRKNYGRSGVKPRKAKKSFEWSDFKTGLGVSSKLGSMTTNGRDVPVELLQPGDKKSSLKEQLLAGCVDRCFVTPWSTEFSEGYLILPNLELADYQQRKDGRLTKKLRKGYAISRMVIGDESVILASNIGQTMDLANSYKSASNVNQTPVLNGLDLQEALRNMQIQSTFSTNFNDFESRSIIGLSDQSPADAAAQINRFLLQAGYHNTDSRVVADAHLSQVGKTLVVLQRDDSLLSVEVHKVFPGKSRVTINQVIKKNRDL